jgi:hypothetical protein
MGLNDGNVLFAFLQHFCKITKLPEQGPNIANCYDNLRIDR